MKFKQLTVKLESKKQQNYEIYQAYIINQSASQEVRGTNLLVGLNVTDKNFATKLVCGQLFNYTDKVVFI